MPDFHIRCRMGAWTCLSFPEQIKRKRKNSINLFPVVAGKKVIALRQFDNERAIGLQLSDGYEVVFKLFGNRSNVIVFKDDQCVDLFRKKINSDLDLKPKDLHRKLSFRFEDFSKDPNVKTQFPTFGNQVLDLLNARGLGKLSVESQWKLIQDVLDELNHPKLYYVSEFKNNIYLTIFPVGKSVKEFKNPLEAATFYFDRYLKYNNLKNNLSRLERLWKKDIAAVSNYLSKSGTRLIKISEKVGYRQKADLIMANLDKVPRGKETVDLPDFYEDTLISIKLNSNLSAQQNAEQYYRKGKNQSLEIKSLKSNMAAKEKVLKTLNVNLEKLADVSNSGELQKLENQIPDRKHSDKGLGKKVTFLERSFEGYQYLIGKSALQNELLLKQFAKKDDMWLHVKDGQGSHVIIKQIPGQNFPQHIIEKGARLASYYSKRKGESWCPVSYTLRKNVRKRKKDPPGMVHMEREEVVLVQPSND